ncbi:hypothetical protein [Nitrincola schmidtii]|jgi:hypothetical protein|uniref:hypothetical protein n=1 Tax=Nitrincola schmidtii TaxID=1730894 RepID=UPI00124E0601|nr:hypothetical protein [Nitrincola schmidtii]TVQ72347.1 MAG: hypothetical protein EA373_02890 [Oceanospirillales bacterium]
MNINGIAAQTSGLMNVNRGLDNTQRAAGDIQGSGQPDRPELASGRGVDQAVNQAAVSQNEATAATQVVREVNETLGSLIDTRA